jgi:hypothetical protein
MLNVIAAFNQRILQASSRRESDISDNNTPDNDQARGDTTGKSYQADEVIRGNALDTLPSSLEEDNAAPGSDNGKQRSEDEESVILGEKAPGGPYQGLTVDFESSNDNIAPITYIEATTDTPRDSETSPVTFPSLTLEKTPLRSTAGVLFEQGEGGVNVSVPVTTEARVIRNIDESTYSNRYDSDGEIGPFFDAVAAEKQYDSDDESLHDQEPEIIAAPAIAVASPNAAPGPTLTAETVNKMTNAQLREALQRLGKSRQGNKTILTERLLSAINVDGTPALPVPAVTVAPAPRRSKDLEAFHPDATWRELRHKETPVIEPERPSHLRGPTVPEGEAEFKKFDFDEEWDRPPFAAMSEVVKLGVKGKPLKGKKGEVLYEKEVRKKGRANLDWIKMHGLTENSKPHEWFEAVLPIKIKRSDTISSVSICDWTSYANLRGTMLNAGTPQFYPSYTPFKPDEYKNFIALYIYQGLNPSPRVSMKFRSQVEDPLQGSDLCSKVFGISGERRHKEWKALATLQCSTKPVPPRSTHPNFKIDPFLAHIQKVSMAAWDLGPNLSGDEQTIGFQGNHCDKQRVQYKH